mmetsp:Transcript_55493/g.104246  ORF Transcript_55493/g.104246 Transcript_55493/m.104246 type:complete len:350 (+) Transcript_55493:60-1109(+)
MPEMTAVGEVATLAVDDNASTSEGNREQYCAAGALAAAGGKIAGGTLASFVAADCIVGAVLMSGWLGYKYGTKLAKNEASDIVGVGLLCKAICHAHDAGYLEAYNCGYCAFLAPPGLPFAKLQSNSPDSQRIASVSTRAVMVDSMAHTFEDGGMACPVYYHAKRDGKKLRISTDQIPAFLLSNGMAPMDAVELEKCLKFHMSQTMQLIECDCIAKYSVQGKTEVAQFNGDHMKGIKPGDVKFRMRFNHDYKMYLENPSKYEDQVKVAVLNALGLDAERLPNAKRHVTIESVKKGSVIAVVIIAGVVVAASTFLAAAFYGYWGNRDSPAPPSPSATPAAPAAAAAPALLR